MILSYQKTNRYIKFSNRLSRILYLRLWSLVVPPIEYQANSIIDCKTIERIFWSTCLNLLSKNFWYYERPVCCYCRCPAKYRPCLFFVEYVGNTPESRSITYTSSNEQYHEASEERPPILFRCWAFFCQNNKISNC
jgi:hypothetical protein